MIIVANHFSSSCWPTTMRPPRRSVTQLVPSGPPSQHRHCLAPTPTCPTLPGVTSVDANLDTQKVTVEVAGGGPEPDAMLETLKKWGENAGKTVSLAE